MRRFSRRRRSGATRWRCCLTGWIVATRWDRTSELTSCRRSSRISRTCRQVGPLFIFLKNLANMPPGGSTVYIPQELHKHAARWVHCLYSSRTAQTCRQVGLLFIFPMNCTNMPLDEGIMFLSLSGHGSAPYHAQSGR